MLSLQKQILKAAAGRALDAAVAAITSELSKGGSVSLGFGTFFRSHVQHATVAILRTGETIKIAASNTLLQGR